MKRMLIAIVIAALTPVYVFADMRCPGGRLITEGTHKIKVLMACGEPVMKEVVGYRWERTSSYKQKLMVEQWTYQVGDRYNVLTIVGGRVESIETVLR